MYYVVLLGCFCRKGVKKNTYYSGMKQTRNKDMNAIYQPTDFFFTDEEEPYKKFIKYLKTELSLRHWMLTTHLNGLRCFPTKVGYPFRLVTNAKKRLPSLLTYILFHNPSMVAGLIACTISAKDISQIKKSMNKTRRYLNSINLKACPRSQN